MPKIFTGGSSSGHPLPSMYEHSQVPERKQTFSVNKAYDDTKGAEKAPAKIEKPVPTSIIGVEKHIPNLMEPPPQTPGHPGEDLMNLFT